MKARGLLRRPEDYYEGQRIITKVRGLLLRSEDYY